ncbi:MAG: sulfotransferase [Rhodobacter sp.]|nr:sulfotransferase [Rhodobacter sp.]
MAKPAAERKSAVEVLNPATGKAPPRRSFVCIGIARGGTSSVAGTMQRLGVFMGNDMENNYEDPAFKGANIAEMKTIIAARQAAHDIWGWKNPHAANHLEHLLPVLENPHLIVVFRDLVATMRAHKRWHQRTTHHAVHEILLQQQRNWFLVERWGLPTALVSYEKLLLDPAGFVTDMASFMGLPVPRTREMRGYIEFLAPGSYK